MGVEFIKLEMGTTATRISSTPKRCFQILLQVDAASVGTVNIGDDATIQEIRVPEAPSWLPVFGPADLYKIFAKGTDVNDILNALVIT